MPTNKHARRSIQVTLFLLSNTALYCLGLEISKLKEDAAERQPWLVKTRRALHQIPELMYEEFETSKFIRGALDEMEIQYR